MKHLLISLMLSLLLVPVCVSAQETKTWQSVELGELDWPAASIDNMFIPLANPSLLATDHANGLGWAHLFMDKKFRKHYWLFANLDGLSYNYEYNKNPLTERSENYHTLAMGSELLPAHILPNLYVGSNYRWRNNKFGKGDFRTALTYRPHNSASLALILDHPYSESPEYHAGVALRPLAWIPSLQDYRVELSADIDYSKEIVDGYGLKAAGDYEFRSPVLGINTQLLDGLNIGATYNLDTETAMVNFSLSSAMTDLGILGNVKEKNNYAFPYVHFAEEAFKPFLGLKGKNWYDMKLNGAVVSYPAPKYSFGQFRLFDKGTRSIEALARELKQAKDDPTIQGILLKNPSFTASYALMQELVAAVRDFKGSGKKIVAYYDNISNGGYIFASSVADQIYLNPLGSLDLRGLSVTSPYFNALLDTLGIDVLNFRSHRYKTAGNMLSESEMTPAEREVYDSMLQSIYGQMIASIEEGRGSKLKSSVSQAIDGGPYYLAQDALDAGLVDGVIYEDELDDKLREEHKFTGKAGSLADYRDYSWTKPKESLVAVIYANGNIVMGKGTPGQNIAHKTTVDLIRAARKNKAYKGIILRVDSGGGSAQASDIILRELQKAQTENKLPVVVSMAGVAASGGYYISCGADRIIADPATLTGSIGVIGLSLNMQRLFDKLHVNWSTVKKGANADYGSIYRPWSEEEKLRMTSMIETIYEDFVSKVDKGRPNLSLEDVHSLAQGRVWTGEQALANGLIDALGGMDTALEQMRELTGIKGKIRLVDATTNPNSVSLQMSGDPFGSLPGMDILSTLADDYIQAYELWRGFHDESILMLSPVNAESVEF